MTKAIPLKDLIKEVNKEKIRLRNQREKRICNVCKKPMFNSLAGEWIDGKFIDVHEKCKK